MPTKMIHRRVETHLRESIIILQQHSPMGDFVMLERFTIKALSIYIRFSHDAEGEASVEYGMLMALIALVMGVTMITFGTSLSTYLDDLGTYISNVFTSSCARIRC